ncbi:hypothetical protein [Streptomyces erythrochromogenes]|uniref:hypothetical protein n=1 Tax=Streptomyces erythrochromogenes TaxID=285574 RepID=UPI00340244E7
MQGPTGAEAATVRIEDVEVGAAYIARIPQRLPAEYRTGPRVLARWQADMQLYMARGRRITVTVTGYGDTPGTVTVTRELPAGRVCLRLTAEQAAGIGLAEGQEYEITGIVTDEADRVITFPSRVEHTIPARWLRPPGEQLAVSADSERFHRALICRNADGMTPQQIDHAAAGALEQVHHVQGLALDDPGYDWGALTAEIDHREWLRIAAYLRAAGLTTYDPRTDPNAVEDPPQVQFGTPPNQT